MRFIFDPIPRPERLAYVADHFNKSRGFSRKFSAFQGDPEELMSFSKPQANAEQNPQEKAPNRP